MAGQLSQSERVAEFKAPLGENVLALIKLDGSEVLGDMFQFNIEALSEKENIDFDKALGQGCMLKLDAYEPARIHRSRLAVEDVRSACDRLLAMSHAERAALPFMHPGRVDVIGAGALIWRRVVDRLVAESGLEEVVVSEHDILDGIAFSIA